MCELYELSLIKPTLPSYIDTGGHDNVYEDLQNLFLDSPFIFVTSSWFYFK